MDTPAISVLHPTLGRPKKAVDTMLSWYRKACWPTLIEYVFSTHKFDATVNDFRSELIERCPPGDKMLVRHCTTSMHGSAANCQNAAAHSEGALLINAADDFEAPEDWDALIVGRLIKEAGRDWPQKPIFMAVSDGQRRDKLCTISIETRKYTEMKGEFLHAGYPGVYSDSEATYRAYRDMRDGKIQLIEAKDIVFLHRHAYFDKSVPLDETYKIQNDPHNYTLGLRLFKERNPRAATDGIMDW